MTRLWLLELRILAGDRTIHLAFVITIVLLAYGLWNGCLWHERRQSAINLVVQAFEGEVAEMKAAVRQHEQTAGSGKAPGIVKGLHPGGLAIGGYPAVLPLTPLSSLAVGWGDLYRSDAKVSLWNNRQDLFAESEHVGPLQLLNGRFDVAFFTVYLMPLVLLACSYNLVSEDREHGTLALVLAQPVSSVTVFLRRLLLRAVALIPPVIVLPVGVLAVSGALPADVRTACAIAIWAILVSTYGLFWLALALWVNAWGRSSGANAVVLAGIWLSIVLLVPSMLAFAIDWAYPPPSRTGLIRALRDARAASEAEAPKLLDRYLSQHPELRPVEGEGASKTFVYPYFLEMWSTSQGIAPLLDRIDAAMERRLSMIAAFRCLSPSLAIEESLNVLAGTDAKRYFGFRRSVEAFHQDWHKYFAPRVFRNIPMRSADYDEFPRYVQVEKSPQELFAEVIRMSQGLFIYSVAALFCAARFHRGRRAA
ncbi:MAG: DUF3526 domain-containing protein [Bryobacteraceae bacterium]